MHAAVWPINPAHNLMARRLLEAEDVSRLRCRRAGPPARHSGGAWTWERIFFAVGAQSEVSAAIHSLCLHSVVLALWQQLGCVCARAFCVSKFAVRGLPRELWATLRLIVCAIEIRAVPALPPILFASISVGSALWQQLELGCVCARAFCVSKFAVRGVPRELWASFSHKVPSCWCVCVCRICLQKR
jgi:hypothetical protein